MMHPSFQRIAYRLPCNRTMKSTKDQDKKRSNSIWNVITKLSFSKMVDFLSSLEANYDLQVK